ncbi:MAG: BON domain-containing protein [Alphaproteobacteria bacterium]|jgi:osmotically-inducible protein OsmY|nr:BON domain-containing protein [Alphaproteobacteria bacterium]
MSSRILVLATLGLLPLTGCAAAAVGAAGAAGVAAAQERTMGEAFDDATTSSEVKARLLSERGGYGEVDVEVSGGLVLLSGRVNTPEQRVKAEDIAWSVERTRDVANEIRIEPPGGFVKNVSDEITTARVRAALFGSSSVKSYNFNIETYDGVVYLMGIARSRGELQAAAEKASYVGGVKQVVSFVRVRDPRPQAARLEGGAYQDAPAGAYAGEQAGERDLLGGAY